MGLLCDGDGEQELLVSGMIGCGGGKEVRRPEVSGLKKKKLEMTDLPLKLTENSSLTDVNRRQ